MYYAELLKVEASFEKAVRESAGEKADGIVKGLCSFTLSQGLTLDQAILSTREAEQQRLVRMFCSKNGFAGMESALLSGMKEGAKTYQELVQARAEEDRKMRLSEEKIRGSMNDDTLTKIAAMLARTPEQRERILKGGEARKQPQAIKR